MESYELISTVQSVCKLKMPGEANDYSNKIVVRRFAVDLQRASKSLEMLEYNWLEDGGLVTQAKFTVVRQFPFPMTSHSEHRFWRPVATEYEVPSQIYARMVLREMSAPRCDEQSAPMSGPCKFCLVYGRKSCCCPKTFRNRLGDEKTPIKCVRVLTGGTWSGYKGVFERAQLTGIVCVKWNLEDSRGAEREVFSSRIPYKCHVGRPDEIDHLIRRFCLWTGQYREPPSMDNRFLDVPKIQAQPHDDSYSYSSFLLEAPISNVSNRSDAQVPLLSVENVYKATGVPVVPAHPVSMYNSVPSVHTAKSLPAVNESLSHVKDYSIASVDPRRSMTFSACLSDSQGQGPVSFSPMHLPPMPVHPENASYRSSASDRRASLLQAPSGVLQGGVVKRQRPYSPPQAVRLSPISVSPSPSCGTGLRSEIDEGASRLMLLRSGAISTGSHHSAYNRSNCLGASPSVHTGPEQAYTSHVQQPSIYVETKQPVSEGETEAPLAGNDLASHALVEGKGKQANWQCHLCGQTFKGKRGNLNRHYQVVHGKERRFACKYPGCGQKFGYRLNQQRHYQNVHEARKYRCDQCEDAFKTEEKLDIHIKVEHEKLKKPYICPICPNTAFGRKSSLTRHMTNLHKPNRRQKDQAPYGVVNTGAAPLRVCM